MESFNGIGACERVLFDVNLLSCVFGSLEISDLFILRCVCRTWNERILGELDRRCYVLKLPKQRYPSFDVRQVLSASNSVFKRQLWLINGWCREQIWKKTLPLLAAASEITVRRTYRMRQSYTHYEDVLQHVGVPSIMNFERYGFSGYVSVSANLKLDNHRVVNIGDCFEEKDLSRFLDGSVVSEINGYVGDHYNHLQGTDKLKLIKEAVFPLELYRLDSNIKLLTNFAKQQVFLVHVEITIVNPDTYEESDVMKIQSAIAEFLVSCRKTLRSLRILNLNCMDVLDACPPFETLEYVEITEAFLPFPCFTGLWIPVFPGKFPVFPKLCTLKLNAGFQQRINTGLQLFHAPLGNVKTLIVPSNLPKELLKLLCPNSTISETSN